MKRPILLALTLILVMGLALTARATDTKERIWEELDLDRMESEVPLQSFELMESAGIQELSPGEILKMDPRAFGDAVQNLFRDTVRRMRQAALSVLAIVFFYAMLQTIAPKSAPAIPFDLTARLAAFAALATPLTDCVLLGAETIQRAARFFLAYVPAYAAVAAAGGSVLTAGAYQTVVLAVCQVVAQLTAHALLPLLECYLALSFAGSLCGQRGLSGLSSAIRKAVNWTLVFLMSLFTGVLSLQGFLGNAADTAATKTAKLVAGSVIPVVGSVITDAWTALRGSIRLIQGSVGSFGVVVTVCTFLPALCAVSTLRLAVLLGRTAGEILGADPVCEILSGCENVLSVLTAFLVSMVALSVVSTATLLFLCRG